MYAQGMALGSRYARHVIFNLVRLGYIRYSAVQEIQRGFEGV